jgi:hypothetical protein
MTFDLRFNERNYFDFTRQNNKYVKPPNNYEITKRLKSGKFPFLITHDIDHLTKRNLSGRFAKFKSSDASLLKKARLLGSMLANSFQMQGWSGIEELLEFHDKRNIRATFFFMSDIVEKRSFHDGYYPLSKIYVSDFRHHSIGILFLRNAVTSSSGFYAEKMRLEKWCSRVIQFSRAHHLFFDKIRTPQILAEHKISLDFTMGWNYHLGYRPELEHLNDSLKLEDARFIATQIQDTALYRHKTAKISQVRNIIDHCKHTGLPFVLLWHNCWVNGGVEESQIIELVEHIQKNGGVTMSADEYYDWVKQ